MPSVDPKLGGASIESSLSTSIGMEEVGGMTAGVGATTAGCFTNRGEGS